jgi:hypothetical protein
MDLWVLGIFFISMYSPWELHNILYVEYFLLHGLNPWWNLCEFMMSLNFGTHSNCIAKCFFPTCFGQSSCLKVVYKVHQPILFILEILCTCHDYRKLGNMSYVLNFSVAKLEITTKITQWTCRGVWHGFPLNQFPFAFY